MKNLAGLRRTTVRQIDFDSGRILENFLRLGDVGCAVFAQREAIFGQVDGGLQNLREGHRAPAVEQRVPRVHDSGESAGEQAVALGNLPAVVFLVPLDGCEFGGARLGVDGVDLLVASVVDENDGVTAHAVEREVGDCKRGLATDGRVEGVAAHSENLAGGFGGLGFHGSDGGVPSANDRTHGLGCIITLCVELGNDREEEKNAWERAYSGMVFVTLVCTTSFGGGIPLFAKNAKDGAPDFS